MGLYRLFFVAVSLAAAQSCGTRLARAEQPKIDTHWVEEVKQQAPKSIERYSSLFRSVDELSVIKTLDVGDPAAKVAGRAREIKVDCSSLDGCVSVKTVKYIDGRSPFINIQARNRLYNFSLTQAAEDGPYILRDYSALDPAEGEGRGQFVLSIVACQDLNQVLDGIQHRNGVSLDALRWDDGKKLLYADITVEGREPKLKRRRELWFRTTEPWHLIERVIHSPQPRVVRTALEYGQALDGVPFPSKMVDESSRSGLAVDRLETTIALSRTSKGVNDFTLTAYGLPEPVEVQSSRQSYRVYWFIGSSVVAGLAALALYRLARWRSLKESRA